MVRPASIIAALLAVAPVALAQVPWPAESWSAATNLTPVEGPGANDFYVDLSGAFWNPLTRRLWVVRNGPSATTSKLWALAESGGSFVIDQRAGLRAEWTGFGDLEAVTQVSLSEDRVYLMIEGEEHITCYSIVPFGTATLLRDWNTRPNLPLSGGLGAEGIAFVPDYHLARWGFVDAAGLPRRSRRGMGGLMLVGHQNGGRVYAFDLSPISDVFDFVGAFTTNDTETAELTFDRSSGLLYTLHGDNHNTIEVTTLASTLVAGERRLHEVLTYGPPTGAPPTANIEGLALQPPSDCSPPGSTGRRSLFLTIDGGGAESLLWFHQFPCLLTHCPADYDADGAVTPADIAGFVGNWSAGLAVGDLSGDFDDNGAAQTADVAAFVTTWFGTLISGCGL